MKEKPHIQIPRVRLGSQGLEVSFFFSYCRLFF